MTYNVQFQTYYILSKILQFGIKRLLIYSDEVLSVFGVAGDYVASISPGSW